LDLGKIAEIAQMATRDEDGDGENDLWGLAIQGHNLYSPLILSNNANIINFDETAELSMLLMTKCH